MWRFWTPFKKYILKNEYILTNTRFRCVEKYWLKNHRLKDWLTKNKKTGSRHKAWLKTWLKQIGALFDPILKNISRFLASFRYGGS